MLENSIAKQTLANTVLVVDDNPTNLRLLVDILHGNGFQVLIAKSGKRALEQLEEMNPDIILLDIKMPDMDGFEVCRQLKTTSLGKDIPVIFMTALTNIESKVEAFKAGAVDYTTKPLQVEEVLARIRTHLSIVNLRRELQRRILELEEYNHKFKQLSIKDSLTGLYNRRYFDECLEHAYKYARRYNHPLCIAVMDIDYFKQINDMFSHKVGDEVLREIAGIFRGQVRQSDTVARYGGEEFVIIFPEATCSDTLQVCERIRLTVEEYDWGKIKPSLKVTISIGISDEVGLESYERMFFRADAKLYEAKNSGRNCVCV